MTPSPCANPAAPGPGRPDRLPRTLGGDPPPPRQGPMGDRRPAALTTSVPAIGPCRTDARRSAAQRSRRNGRGWRRRRSAPRRRIGGARPIAGPRGPGCGARPEHGDAIRRSVTREPGIRPPQAGSRRGRCPCEAGRPGAISRRRGSRTEAEACSRRAAPDGPAGEARRTGPWRIRASWAGLRDGRLTHPRCW